MKPYYEHGGITVYHGDCREILPGLGMRFDAVITDPPYGETSLEWDVWPGGWPALAATVSDCLWCFGSMRMFWEQRDEFKAWKLAQDVVWEKHTGSGFAADRFKRVHELALQFYRGEWKALQHAVPTVERVGASKRIVKRSACQHTGKIGDVGYEDDGTRLMRSVIPVRSCHGYAVNETQKPEGIVAPLVEYSVPVGGIVADLFAGSGTTLAAAKHQGKRAIGFEMRESQCEEIARRLDQQVLQLA